MVGNECGKRKIVNALWTTFFAISWVNMICYFFFILLFFCFSAHLQLSVSPFPAYNFLFFFWYSSLLLQTYFCLFFFTAVLVTVARWRYIDVHIIFFFFCFSVRLNNSYKTSTNEIYRWRNGIFEIKPRCVRMCLRLMIHDTHTHTRTSVQEKRERISYGTCNQQNFRIPDSGYRTYSLKWLSSKRILSPEKSSH